MRAKYGPQTLQAHRIKADGAILPGRGHNALKAQAQFFDQPYRRSIVGRDDCGQAIQPQIVAGVQNDGLRGFMSVAPATVFRQQRESDVDIVETVAPKQAADTNGYVTGKECHPVWTVTVVRVQAQHRVRERLPSLVNGPNTPIANMADESRIVPYGQHQPGIIKVQPAQPQALGLQSKRLGYPAALIPISHE